MGLSIKELFTYKKEVPLVDKNGEQVAKAWVRLLGDEDLNQAYKEARVHSLRKREKLKDEETLDHKDEIEPVSGLKRDELIIMILEAKRNRFTSEAFVKVDREELPKIEDVVGPGGEPDAPQLEDQETLDKVTIEQQKNYTSRIDDYIETRIKEAKADLDSQSDENLIKTAKEEMINVLPLNSFFAELSAQKAFRGSYEDKGCTKRIFSSIEEYYNADSQLKSQLVSAYTSLELGADDIKN